MANILQLVDSLAIGGLERVAVDLANGLSTAHSSMLCSTRMSGPLQENLLGSVDYLRLERSGRFDLASARRCASWAQDRKVNILHAHGSSLWFANLILHAWKGDHRPRLVWHDHFGRYLTERRNSLLYRALTMRVSALISVNSALREWAISELGKAPNRCHFVANSVDLGPYEGGRGPTRPSSKGAPITIICVANLRRQKNHRMLLDAVAALLANSSTAHPSPIRLQLVGIAPEPGVKDELESHTRNLGLESVVEFLGERTDVPQLLHSADIGVLSSSSEGLPLALLEYGAAALPVVATAVGQVPSVITGEENGMLVASGDVDAFASALRRLIDQPAERKRLGDALRDRVITGFSQQATLDQITAIYDGLLGKGDR